VSSHQRDFGHKEAVPGNKFDKAAIQDFRSAHFHFGNAQNPYVSEQHAQYG
jgi:hypothetical protein